MKSVRNSSQAQEPLKFEVGEHKNQDSLCTQAWEYFQRLLAFPFAFCGGLATLFSGTATVESSFSVLQWEGDPSRSGLWDLSLEGIPQ